MSFDLAKYQIGNEPTKITVEIPETGDSFELTVKNLSWSKQNRLLSNSVIISKGGGTSFDGDAYVKSYLKEYIIEAPWGKTTEAFLVSIDERLGRALETLVPKLDDEETVDTAEVKKE
jgi:hypothetical protein|tara:strand:+ start:4294 stop:4647 length:354 start_codon:yes stop_codon:yes gene_type:complete